jgi:dTDP-6-deoxy-L-talose 4-dehydrogenase (NAD+)
MKGPVLLTGASGFVGRQVLDALEQRAVAVRVVSRTGGRPVRASVNVERILPTPDVFAEPEDWWASACEGIDTVIHTAWYAEPGKYLQSPRNLDCLIGTLRLAKGCVRSGVRRFVGIGTCFEYDLSGGTLSVATPLRPLTPYAGTKAAAFFALSQWLPAQGAEFVWCRLFYLYGEAEDSRRLVPYLRERLAAGEPAELTEGSQVRDFLDVTDAAQMIVETAAGQTQGAVNICSGVGITVRQLAERIADEYGRRDLLRFGARPPNSLDPPVVIGVP